MQNPPKPCCRAQEVLHDEGADQVAVNFFGDGTCNVGAQRLLFSTISTKTHAQVDRIQYNK
jgi:hypothetical protein